MKRFYKRRYRMIARVVWKYCRQGMGRFKGEWKKYENVECLSDDGIYGNCRS